VIASRVNPEIANGLMAMPSPGFVGLGVRGRRDHRRTNIPIRCDEDAAEYEIIIRVRAKAPRTTVTDDERLRRFFDKINRVVIAEFRRDEFGKLNVRSVLAILMAQALKGADADERQRLLEAANSDPATLIRQSFKVYGSVGTRIGRDDLAPALTKLSLSSSRRANRVFTPSAIDKIRSLAAQGKLAKEIAEVIGSTAASVRVKCSQLKISLRRRHTDQIGEQSLVVYLQAADYVTLNRKAVEMQKSVGELSRELLKAIIRSDIYEAVLDEEK
jgi:hypothetical protein